MLSEEELEYKNKLLSITNSKELTDFIENGFMSKHRILLMDKEIGEHISKYAPYEEDPEIGCFGFIRKD